MMGNYREDRTGLDVHGDPLGPKIAVESRVEKIEKDVRALDDKLDLILATMKENANLPWKPSVYDSDEAEELRKS